MEKVLGTISTNSAAALCKHYYGPVWKALYLIFIACISAFAILMLNVFQPQIGGDPVYKDLALAIILITLGSFIAQNKDYIYFHLRNFYHRLIGNKPQYVPSELLKIGLAKFNIIVNTNLPKININQTFYSAEWWQKPLDNTVQRTIGYVVNALTLTTLSVKHEFLALRSRSYWVSAATMMTLQSC